MNFFANDIQRLFDATIIWFLI